MKRPDPTYGLAVSAVCALALTGLPLTPTQAVAAAPQVVLLSQYNEGHDASVRDDDTNSTVRLEAEKRGAGVSVTFEYNTDPTAANGAAGWTAIPGATADEGSFVYAEWNAAALAGTTVAVRAVATDGGSTAYSKRNNVAVVGDSSVESLALSTGTTKGYFVQPYASSSRTGKLVGLSGTTSATDGTVALSQWRSSDGTFRGTTNARVEEYCSKVFCIDPNDITGRFTGAVDISGNGAGAGDAVAFGAERDTDSVEAYDLYKQAVGAISASPDGQARPDRKADVTVFVADDTSAPVAGAEVRRARDKLLVGYTGGDGTVVARQQGGSTERYYVNTTDDDAFQSGTDFRTDPVTVPVFTPTPQFSQAVLDDGSVFDDDEYRSGDVYVLVTTDGPPDPDASLPFPTSDTAPAGVEVQYKLYPTGEVPPADYSIATTDDEGRAVIPFDPDGVDGEYTLDFIGPESGAVMQTTTFTAGDATLTLTPDPASDTGKGGRIDYVGSLAVGATPLPGRVIDLTYRRGLEHVPGRTPDAGLVGSGGLKLSRTVLTETDGTFTVAIDDPAESPAATESGGRLTAATGDNKPSETSTLDGNADERATRKTQFGSGKGSVDVRLKGSTRRDRDRLRITAPKSVSGEKIKLFRVTDGGALKLVGKKRIKRDGTATITVRDRNGRDRTRYVAKLKESRRVEGSTSNEIRLR